MPYLIKTSVSVTSFGEIRKLRRYDLDDIKAAHKGKLTVRVDNPKSLGDLVRAGSLMPVFSESFIDLLRNTGVNKFKSFKINLAYRDQILEYYYLEPELNLKSIPINRINHKTLDLNNVFLDDSLDWSDSLYGISNTFELLCSDEIKNLIEEAGLKNIQFERVNFVPFDEFNKPIFFYHVDHGWANKYYWLKPQTNLAGISRPNIQSVFTRDKGTTVADAHGSTLAETYFSARVLEFFRSLGSKLEFYQVVTDSSLNHAELYYVEIQNKLPFSKDPIYNDSIAGTLKVSGYGNLSSWDSQNPFSIENTRYLLINHPIRKLMEAQTFQNIYFRRMRYITKGS